MSNTPKLPKPKLKRRNPPSHRPLAAARRAMLVLSIGDAPYEVGIVGAATAGSMVRLRKPDGTEYLALRDQFGVATCDCPDATHRPDKAPCKHVAALVAVGLFGGPEGPRP